MVSLPLLLWMIKIEFPAPDFRVKEVEGKELIFDVFRKQWVLLTPEEWVRQNIVRYLVETKKYPASLIALEKVMALGELKKRFDVLVYDTDHKPWMMLECKAMDVELTQKVVEQIIRYNLSIPVPYLVVSNGSFTYGWDRTTGTLLSIEELPAYPMHKPTQN